MSDGRDNWTLKTRWVMQRNAVLGSARFQQWAGRVPVFRWIAQRRAAAQFDLVAGFVYSQILTAFVEAGLVEFLNGRPRSLEDIADFVKLKTDAAECLLKGAAALSLAESPQLGLWTLGQAGAELSANTGAMAMIRHHRLLYRDLSVPLELLSKGRSEETALSAFWTYASKNSVGRPSDGPNYSALMAATQPMVSQQIIDVYDFSKHRRMLDIGGGSGAFVMAVAAVAPSLQFGIFDLPEVIAEAESRSGRDPRIRFHEGSFKLDPVPHGYDLITLSRILHDHDDDVVTALLFNIRAALPAGGQLMVVEPMADTRGAERMGHGYFGLYLWAMNSGRPRSAAEIRMMLRNAGFSRVKTINTALPIITSALLASN
jgi:demethylspheroidene O-methyltransferase